MPSMEGDLFQVFIHRLRERHREVLELACLGMQNEAIGDVLGIEKSVVAGYLSDVYGELQNVERFHDAMIRRPLVISVFAPFFARHPELRSEQVRRLLNLNKPGWARPLYGEEEGGSAGLPIARAPKPKPTLPTQKKARE